MPIDAKGYTRPTRAEILLDIERSVHSNVSPEIDLSESTPLGAFAGLVADRVSAIYDGIQQVYNSNDPAKTTGVLLTNLAKLTGTQRRQVSYTETIATCTLEEGTLLESGVHFAALDGDPDVRATPAENYTAASSGALPVLFRAELAGPVDLPSGKLTVIATAVNGWTAITNGDPIALGRNADDDDTLRARREEQLAVSGSATILAIAADVEKLTGVEVVLVLENYTDAVNANGVPPHSTEAIVWGNSADDDEIAQAIWDNRAGGIRPYGTTSGTAVDASGESRTVPFSRAIEKQIYLSYDVEGGSDFNPSDLIEAVQNRANELFTMGSTVIWSRVFALPFELGLNVVKINSVGLGLSPSPTGTADIPSTIREVPRFDGARIHVSA